MSALSLVIPVFNECGNLLPLAAALDACRPADFLEAVWVDNGSTDGSAKELVALKRLYPWARVFTICKNRGYGGGVIAGVMAASLDASHIGWIPADGQVDARELFAVWEKARNAPGVHKGKRCKRLDSASQKFVSRTYSRLAYLILGLPTKDTNGLPKIFPASFLRESCFHNPETTGFVFDASMLYYAHRKQIPIFEHPVSFLSRRSGKSSWSGRRMATYSDVARALWRLRESREGR